MRQGTTPQFTKPTPNISSPLALHTLIILSLRSQKFGQGERNIPCQSCTWAYGKTGCVAVGAILEIPFWRRENERRAGGGCFCKHSREGERVRSTIATTDIAKSPTVRLPTIPPPFLFLSSSFSPPDPICIFIPVI